MLRVGVPGISLERAHNAGSEAALCVAVVVVNSVLSTATHCVERADDCGRDDGYTDTGAYACFSACGEAIAAAAADTFSLEAGDAGGALSAGYYGSGVDG